MCSGSVMGFGLISIGILMALISPSARAADPPRALTPDPVTGGERARPEAPYLHLPMFLHYWKPRVDKQHFSPVRVNSQKPLPERVRKLLLPEPRRHLKARARPSGPVTVTCNAREMRVRVHTANLGASGERVHVRLGTCGVSRSTERGVLFRSELHRCGTHRQIVNKTVVYSNMLHYTPDASVPGSDQFSVPVQCHFNRFHYSYKIGFMPSVERLKFFKPMKTKGSVTLTACDAQWNRLSPDEGFVIGQPMYFEVKTLHVPETERLFVHFCHVTPNSSRDSTPRVNVISNYGCLLDSKRSRKSRFINGTMRNVIRFTIDAFALQGKAQKHLFIHCEMSIRNIVPTETSKSCTYNHLEHRWEELYGSDSVCSCCDSSCVPVMPSPMRPLASELGALVDQRLQGKSRLNPAQSTEGVFTPELDHGVPGTEIQHKTLVPERTRSLEHRTVTPESKLAVLTTEREHTTLTLEHKHGILMPDSEHGVLTPEHEYRTLLLENMHGKVAVEILPTLESENTMLMPLTPDMDHEEIAPYPSETVISGVLTPSVKQHASTPVHASTELREPYRVFEEVFGLG